MSETKVCVTPVCLLEGRKPQCNTLGCGSLREDIDLSEVDDIKKMTGKLADEYRIYTSCVQGSGQKVKSFDEWLNGSENDE